MLVTTRLKAPGEPNGRYGVLLNSSSGGVFPIAPTPFRPNGEIDAASIERLIQTYRNVGANGATVLGMMGEAQKLDASEAVEVAAQFIKGMDLPVIVGGGRRGSSSPPRRICVPMIKSSATSSRRWKRSAAMFRSSSRTILWC